MSNERKASLTPGIKAVLKKYKMKGTIAKDGHSGIRVTLKSGPIHFDTDYHQVNPYWINEHYQGVRAKFLTELKNAMSVGNWNNSDIQTDYFDIGWYIYINIGKWNKPYVVEK